ncbi:hypothetical protein NL676_002805 [Syzygium grande]|nr:hypothetical protein NL676_002805 [Syzygium grande]
MSSQPRRKENQARETTPRSDTLAERSGWSHVLNSRAARIPPRDPKQKPKKRKNPRPLETPRKPRRGADLWYLANVGRHGGGGGGGGGGGFVHDGARANREFPASWPARNSPKAERATRSTAPQIGEQRGDEDEGEEEEKSKSAAAAAAAAGEGRTTGGPFRSLQESDRRLRRQPRRSTHTNSSFPPIS